MFFSKQSIYLVNFYVKIRLLSLRQFHGLSGLPNIEHQIVKKRPGRDTLPDVFSGNIIFSSLPMEGNPCWEIFTLKAFGFHSKDGHAARRTTG